MLDKPANDMTTSQIVTTMQQLMSELQARTVGLADIDGSMLPIVDYQRNSDKITVVKVNGLLAMGIVHLQRDSANKAIIFENGQNIKDYVKSPVAFNKVLQNFAASKPTT